MQRARCQRDRVARRGLPQCGPKASSRAVPTAFWHTLSSSPEPTAQCSLSICPLLLQRLGVAMVPRVMPPMLPRRLLSPCSTLSTCCSGWYILGFRRRSDVGAAPPAESCVRTARKNVPCEAPDPADAGCLTMGWCSGCGAGSAISWNSNKVCLPPCTLLHPAAVRYRLSHQLSRATRAELAERGDPPVVRVPPGSCPPRTTRAGSSSLSWWTT
jgi:hypothetical protein